MKKIILIFIAIMVGVGFYFWQKSPELKMDQIDTITLISYPSPPKYKIVDDREDIKRFIEYVNSLDLTPTLSNDKGWWFKALVNENNTITFFDDFVKVDFRTFKIKNAEYSSTLQTLYESMDYDEKEWGK